MFRKTTRVTRLLSLLLATLMLLLMLPLSGLADFPQDDPNTGGVTDPGANTTTVMTPGGTDANAGNGVGGGGEGGGEGAGNTGNGEGGEGANTGDPGNTGGENDIPDPNANISGGEGDGEGDPNNVDPNANNGDDADKLLAGSEGDLDLGLSAALSTTAAVESTVTKLYPALFVGVYTRGPFEFKTGSTNSQLFNLQLFNNISDLSNGSGYSTDTIVDKYTVYLEVDKQLYIDIMLSGQQGNSNVSDIKEVDSIEIDGDPEHKYYAIEFSNVNVSASSASYAANASLALRFLGATTPNGYPALVSVFGASVDGELPMLNISGNEEAFEEWYAYAKASNQVNELKFLAIAQSPEVAYDTFNPITATVTDTSLTLSDIKNGKTIAASNTEDGYLFSFQVNVSDTVNETSNFMNVDKYYPAVKITAKTPEVIDFVSKQPAIDLFDFGSLTGNADLLPKVTLADSVITMEWPDGLTQAQLELLEAATISLKEVQYKGNNGGEQPWVGGPHFTVEYVTAATNPSEKDPGSFKDIEGNIIPILANDNQVGWNVIINFPFDKDVFNDTDKFVKTAKNPIPFYYSSVAGAKDVVAATDYGRKPGGTATTATTTKRDYMTNDKLLAETIDSEQYSHGNKMWFELSFEQNTMRDGIKNPAVEEIILKEVAGTSFIATDMKIIGFASGIYNLLPVSATPDDGGLLKAMTLTVKVTYGDDSVQNFPINLSAAETVAFIDGTNTVVGLDATRAALGIKSVEFIYNNVPNTSESDSIFTSKPMVLFEAIDDPNDTYDYKKNGGFKGINNYVFMEYTPFKPADESATAVKYTYDAPEPLAATDLRANNNTPYIKNFMDLISLKKYTDNDGSKKPGDEVTYWLEVVASDDINFNINSVIIRDYMNEALKLAGNNKATVYVMDGTNAASDIAPYRFPAVTGEGTHYTGKAIDSVAYAGQTYTKNGMMYTDVELYPYTKESVEGEKAADVIKKLQYWGLLGTDGKYTFPDKTTGFILLLKESDTAPFGQKLAVGGRIIVEYKAILDTTAPTGTPLSNKFDASFFPIFHNGSGDGPTWDPEGSDNGSNDLITAPARYAFANIKKQVRQGVIDDVSSFSDTAPTLKLSPLSYPKGDATKETVDVLERDVTFKITAGVNGSPNPSTAPMIIDYLPANYTFGDLPSNPSDSDAIEAYLKGGSVRVMYKGEVLDYVALGSAGTGYTGKITGSKIEISLVGITLPETTAVNGAELYFTVEYEAKAPSEIEIPVTKPNVVTSETFAYFEPNAGEPGSGFIAKSSGDYPGSATSYSALAKTDSGYIQKTFAGDYIGEDIASAYRFAVREGATITYARTGPEVSLKKEVVDADGNVIKNPTYSATQTVLYKVVFTNNGAESITVAKIADLLPQGQRPAEEIALANNIVVIGKDGKLAFTVNEDRTNWLDKNSENGIIGGNKADQYRWEIDLNTPIILATDETITITYSAQVVSLEDLLATGLLKPSSAAISGAYTNTVAVYPTSDACVGGNWLKGSSTASPAGLSILNEDGNEALKVITANANVKYSVAAIAPNVEKTVVNESGNETTSFQTPSENGSLVIGWKAVVANGSNAGKVLTNYEVYDLLPADTYMTAAWADAFNENTEGVTVTRYNNSGALATTDTDGTVLKFTFDFTGNPKWNLGAGKKEDLPQFNITVPYRATITGKITNYIYITPKNEGDLFLSKGSNFSNGDLNKLVGEKTGERLPGAIENVAGGNDKSVVNAASATFIGSLGVDAVKYLSHNSEFSGDEGDAWTSSRSTAKHTSGIQRVLDVVRGQSVYYKVELKNTSSAPFHSYSFIDVLPRDNDFFAVYGVGRLSKWGPTIDLLESISVDVLDKDGESRKFPENAYDIYITTDANAANYANLEDFSAFGTSKWITLEAFVAGVDSGDFKAEDAIAYRVLVGERAVTGANDGRDPSMTYALGTGEKLVVSWAMTVPNDTQYNATAWNSAAFAIWYGDRTIARAETDKVGIKTLGDEFDLRLEKVLVNGKSNYRDFDFELERLEEGSWEPVEDSISINVPATESSNYLVFEGVVNGSFRVKESEESAEGTRSVKYEYSSDGENWTEIKPSDDGYCYFDLTGAAGYIRVTNEYTRSTIIEDPDPDPNPDPDPDPNPNPDPDPTPNLPTPTEDGNRLESSENGYVEFGEGEVALGEWTQNEDGEWIFDEFPPLAALQTGDNATMFIWGGIAVAALAGLVVIFTKKKRA